VLWFTKIHKAGSPLRIIVSSLGSPVYKVARFLHEILTLSINKPTSHIKNGWSFANFIKNTAINDDEILVSLNVTSLFNNIPKDLVFKAIENRWPEIAKSTKFNLPQFLHAIDIVLSSTSFCFNGVFYDQIFGSPMGSPLSPVLADLVLEDLEVDCLKKLPFEVSVFYRYVDDILSGLHLDTVQMYTVQMDTKFSTQNIRHC